MIDAAHSSARFANSSSSNAAATSQPRPGTESANETDSNADACCLEADFATLEHATKQVDVHAHDESIKPLLNVPVVSGATAWDDPVSDQTCVLVVDEALCCGTKSDHSPINPNQIRSFGVDCWDNPFDKSRPISVRPVDHDAIIPLNTTGTKIQFLSRAPTTKENSCTVLTFN